MVNDHHFDAFKFLHVYLAFLRCIPAVHFGEHLDSTDSIRRFDITRIQFSARDAHQFFGGPFEIRLDCLGEFFFHRLFQFGDNSLDVFTACAFAGTGGELRTLWVTSEFCQRRMEAIYSSVIETARSEVKSSFLSYDRNDLNSLLFSLRDLIPLAKTSADLIGL